MSQGFDPLGECADPRRYVPLATSEQILAALAEHVDAGASPILLAGPSGVGKTLLLHVLGEHARAAGQRVVYSPFLHLEPTECARWLLHLLEIPTDGGASPEATLFDALRAPDSRPTLLLVDEIQAAPEASVQRLAELARSGRPALAVVAAGSEGRHLRKRIPVLAPEATLRFPNALPDEEIGALYGAILARPELSPHVRRALSPERDEIMRAASGLPRLLKAELDVRAHNFTVRGGPKRRLQEIEELCLDTWVAPLPVESVDVGAAAAAALQEDVPELALDATRPSRATPAWARRASARRVAAGASRVAAGASRVAAGASRAAAGARGAAAGALGAVTRARRAVAGGALDAATGARRAAAGALAGAVGAATGASRAAAGASRATVAALHATRESLRAWSAIAAREAGRSRERMTEGVQHAGHAVRLQRDVALARGALAARQISSAAHGVQSAAASASGAALDSFLRVGGVALPAAALCGLVLLLNSDLFGIQTGRITEIDGAPAPQAELFAPDTDDAQVALLPDLTLDPAPSELPAPIPVQVRAQFNARPWARIRIDGVDVGPTPLSHPLPPGSYEIEAVFADGRSLQRRVEIGPERRFVALP